MSDPTTILVHDPNMSSTWHQSAAYRWAVLQGTSTEPPVLQVAWVSSMGEIVWRRLETVVVSREDYDRT